MGNKNSSKKSGGSTEENLHPHEKRRLTTYLEENKKKNSVFTAVETHNLWNEILAPDLLDSYTKYIFNSKRGLRSSVGLNEFIRVYVDIVRGSTEDKTKAIASIIGTQKNNEGKEVLSFQSLCKYLSDLMESFLTGLHHRSDLCYQSWAHENEPKRNVIEDVMKGVCNDLKRTDDEVKIECLENWLNQSALVNLLHSHVLGSMYNLTPELESTMIPLAQLPMKTSNKFSMMLDVSQVVFLNSLLPSENKEVWRLLFSVNVHGESFSKFLTNISNQGPILLVVRTTTNHMFGGFISTNVTPSPKWIGSERSFIFTLGPQVDVYFTTGYNDHYAYLNFHQSTLPNGLGMGGQYDYWGLWIDAQFGVGECSESCTTYKNYKMLDSNKKFHIKSMEVWGVGDAPPTEEERGVRKSPKSGRSALDQDPTSTQILEMAGREMHSKGLRHSTIGVKQQ